jgi:RecB family exonuclease
MLLSGLINKAGTVSDYLSQLKQIIRDHPLEEKILVVSSYRIGRQIGEALTLEGVSWTNLRYATPRALAQETVSLEMAESGFRPISEITQFFLLESIFSSIKRRGMGTYFTELESAAGIIRRLQNSISDLRMSGLTSADLSPGQFEDESKGQSLIRLMRQYEKALKLEKWLDEADLYHLALEKTLEPAAEEKSFILCFQNRILAELPHRFLKKVSQNRIIWLTRAPISGLAPPRRYQKSGHAVPGPEDASSKIFAWLFDPGKAPASKNSEALEIFSAVGAVNECREILRRIHREKHRFDEVEIIYPSGSSYASHLYSLCRRNGIDITFAEGYELGWTSPGKLFSGLLDWMESGYQTKVITGLINGRNLALGKYSPELNPEAAVKILHASKIGWGKNRYLEGLENFKSKAEKKQPENRAGQNKKRKDIVSASKLIDLFRRIFRMLPDMSSSIQLRSNELSDSLIQVLDEFAVTHNEIDEDVVQTLQRRLAEASMIETGPQRSEVVLNWMRDLSYSVKVRGSGPLPGCVHASSYANGGFSGRKITFACGLDQSRFPGAAQEDPILLDGERAKVSKNLSLSADILRENLFDIAELLASVRGRLILSFSVFDVVEERGSFPSSIILQAFRLQKRNDKLDYSDLMEAVSPEAGFFPSSPEYALDPQEWWLARISDRGRLRDGEESVRKQYPELNAGLKAREKRNEAQLTEYEGKIGPLPPSLNPLNNPELVLSASRLEELAECPYKYFLHHILGLELPEEIEFDPSRWLNPMERGSLLHEIYCDFMTELNQKGERLRINRHRCLIMDIAESKLKKMRREIPPPSEVIYIKERKEIKESLELFLTLEAKNAAGHPCLFETAFGMSDKPEEVKPVKIPVGGKTLYLRGIIDRIDQIGKNTYRVIDYKTGGTNKYEDLEKFKEGKILQHALYAIAAGEIIRKRGLSGAPEIKESGYYFPTLKGEGREIYIPPPGLESVSEVLGELTRWIEKGLFPVHPNTSCAYCDYQLVCGADASERAKKKLDPDSFEIFNQLKIHK